jgi:ketosteroid isomerase-like protein
MSFMGLPSSGEKRLVPHSMAGTAPERRDTTIGRPLYTEPATHEILVLGDLAVVHPTWTLTAGKSGARDVTTDEGMDVFRRGPDGVWSIAR